MKKKLNQECIPIPYKVILKRLWKNSDYDGRVGTRNARIILVKIFRMEKENVHNLIEEMKDLGYVDLLNHKFIKIAVPYNQLC